MAQFTFQISMTRKDGSQEQAGQIKLTHKEYDGHNEQTALAYLTQHKAEYGFTVDHEAQMVMCGGVMIPLADFARLEVKLISKAVE